MERLLIGASAKLRLTNPILSSHTKAISQKIGGDLT